MTISEVLAGHLEASGMTQEVAAGQVGVKQSVISRWVRGTDAPSNKYVTDIARLTGLSEANVLEAIHQQRLKSGAASLPRRVTALEGDMEEVKSQLRELLARLEGKRR